MILLDFHAGSHGHFLEYVINAWLFNGPRLKEIFTNLGASHLIRQDNEYMAKKVVTANHYTEYSLPHATPTKIIRIGINNDWANWIYQINALARGGNISMGKKLQHLPGSIRANPNTLRQAFYARLNMLDGYQDIKIPWPKPLPGTNWLWQDVLSFDFPMESLFDLKELHTELHRLAGFLETTFVPDSELDNLLTDFLNKNQGWQYYTKSKQLVQDALTGKQNIKFNSDEVLQAFINSVLTKSFGLVGGTLFEDNVYPVDTDQLCNTVNYHLRNINQ